MENLFIDIIEMTLPVTAFITLLLLCSPLLKHSYVAKWRYYMWLFVAVRLVLPFKININKAITIPVELRSGEAAANAAAAGELSLSRILTMIWILGMAVFTVYQIFCYISFKRTVNRWSKKAPDADTMKAFGEAKSFAGVKRGIDIKICKTVSTPMVFGLIKPVLLLPDMKFDSGDLPIILRHELIHFKRHDIWVKLLLIAAKTVHWFNPVVYLMYRAADRDIELACDAEVVKNTDSEYRRHYCEAIMNLVHNGCARNTALSTCFIFSKKTVMERFKSILDEKIKRSGVVMFCVAAVSIALSGSLITFATAQVAEEIEDNRHIVERPVDIPKPTEEPFAPTEEPFAPTEKPSAQSEERSETDDTPEENAGSYDYNNSYNDIDESQSYSEPERRSGEPAADIMPETDADIMSEADAEPVDIDEERTEVYDRLGEPDSVSGDGSKETYSLPDGATVILQYEGDTLEEGYILVD